jgi:hypothetical protein
MMRVGEYAANGKRSTHQLMCDQVEYELDDGSCVTAPVLRALHKEADVKGVLVIFRGDKTHHKTDESVHFISGYEDSSEPERWLTSLMVDWGVKSKVQIEDPFFTRYEDNRKMKDSRRVLRTKDISDFLRVCESAGSVPKNTFKPHSIRSGGASELSRAGVLPEQIDHLGRWAIGSTASRKYRMQMDRTAGALSNMENGKAKHTKANIRSANTVGISKKRKREEPSIPLHLRSMV